MSIERLNLTPTYVTKPYYYNNITVYKSLILL